MAKTVVFGVDLQNDFGHPLGSLYCKSAFRVVGGGMILVEHATNSNSSTYEWLIMFSACDHPKNSNHFKPHGLWPPHCIHGTWGAKSLPGIKLPVGPVQVFYKGTGADEDGYDPFKGKNNQGRTLDQILIHPDETTETTIIVWGIATNYCVRALVLTARQKGYKVYVALDACAAVPTPENPPADFVTEEQAIEEMKAVGAIMTTVEEVVSGKI